VACFSLLKNSLQHATFHHQFTTFSPSKNHRQPPTFSKTPLKNAAKH